MKCGVAKAILTGLCLLLFAAASWAEDTAKPQAVWPDTFLARLEALALLQSLNSDLLTNESATLTLDSWCETHKLASQARIVAERVRGEDKPVTENQRKLLKVSAEEPLKYRRVRLRCGDRVLSEADNWYVPARLTPEMNQALDTTDIAFGRAVQALHFHRQRLAAILLWSPLPNGWEMGTELPKSSQTALEIPSHLLQHHAVLMLPDGTPFSEVVETYTSAVLAFPVVHYPF